MDVADKIVAVTGAARGIGRALARCCAGAGARAVVMVDRDAPALGRAAAAIGGHALPADVGDEAAIGAVIDRAEDDVGPIDLYFSNAGIARLAEPDSANEVWAQCWQVNVMAHVYASRALVPRMLARGGGAFVVTASAAGLLTQIGSASYAVTKHAAVAFAEFLSITYGDRGLEVSVLCPQAVRTDMIADVPQGGVAALDGVLEPEAVAEHVLGALRERRFLITPHPQVLEYLRRKTADYERWLRGMRRLRRQYGD